MKNVLATISALALLGFGPAFAQTPVLVSREAAQQHVQQLVTTLNALLNQLGQSAVMRAVPEGQQAIATVAGLLNPARELERMLSAAPMVTPQGAVPVAPPPAPVVVHVPAPEPPPPPPVPAGPTAISDSDLGRIVGAVRGETFSRDQLGVLQSAVGSHHFTIGQSRQILQLFSFSRDQLAALRILAPRILDKQNAFELNSLFSFSRDKKQAREILGQ